MVDAELVLKFKGGEESAFEALVRKYMKDAYSFCLKLTHDAQEAEELSQMGFVSAYRALRGFRGESSFKSWLYRIFINQYRDHLRQIDRHCSKLRPEIGAKHLRAAAADLEWLEDAGAELSAALG